MLLGQGLALHEARPGTQEKLQLGLQGPQLLSPLQASCPQAELQVPMTCVTQRRCESCPSEP